MNDLTALKSYANLKIVSDLLDIRMPQLLTPFEEERLVASAGQIGWMFISECRAALYAAEIGRDRLRTPFELLHRMVMCSSLDATHPLRLYVAQGGSGLCSDHTITH